MAWASASHPERPEVLVVDDDVDIRETLRFVLEDAGYTVYEAPDGRPALARLRTHPRGMVIILDWNMPGMDGQALLQAVTAELPLATRNAYILLSAYTDGKRTLPLALAKLLTQVEAQVVGKPFDVDVLLAAVDRAAARLRKEQARDKAQNNHLPATDTTAILAVLYSLEAGAHCPNSQTRCAVAPCACSPWDCDCDTGQRARMPTLPTGPQ